MIALKTPVKTIAKKLGVTTQAVYAWKAGRYAPSITKLVQLAKLEGKTVDKLLR